MKFTNKFEQARLKVAVLNLDLVPDLVDVVIGEYVYELQFWVENEGTGEDPQPIDMDAPFDEDNIIVVTRTMIMKSLWRRTAKRMRWHQDSRRRAYL